MSRKLAAAALSILVALPAREVLAEEAPRLEPGRTVRLWTVGSPSPDFEGILLSLDDSAVTLDIAGRSTHAVVPRDKIARLDVSAGRHSRGRQALIGTSVGALFGASLGLLEGDDDPNLFLAFSAKEKAVLLGAEGALVGLIIGAIARPPQKWTKVAADRFKLNVALPRGGGVGASVSLRF